MPTMVRAAGAVPEALEAMEPMEPRTPLVAQEAQDWLPQSQAAASLGPGVVAVVRGLHRQQVVLPEEMVVQGVAETVRDSPT